MKAEPDGGRVKAEPDRGAVGATLWAKMSRPATSVDAGPAEAGGAWQPIAFHAPTGVVLVEADGFIDGGERRALLWEVDPVAGELTYYTPSTSGNAAFAFDGEYQNLVMVDGDQLIVDGRTLNLGICVSNLDW